MTKDIMSNLLQKFNPNKSAGGMLLVLNALGMVFAAASNTFAAASDKNTSKEDKKFLVPAGALTGVANIGLYYAMTTKIIDKLQGKVKVNKDNSVEVVKGLADNVIEKMEANGTFNKNAMNYIDKAISKAKNGKFFGLGKKSEDYVSSMVSTLKSGNELTEAGKYLYKNSVKSGFGVLGAFIGAVVGCAILTPIIRDASAYLVQKRMEKKNPNMQNEPYQPYFDPSHTKVDLANFNRRVPLTMKSFMISTNGRMKV